MEVAGGLRVCFLPEKSGGGRTGSFIIATALSFLKEYNCTQFTCFLSGESPSGSSFNRSNISSFAATQKWGRQNWRHREWVGFVSRQNHDASATGPTLDVAQPPQMFARTYISSWRIHKQVCTFVSNQSPVRKTPSMSTYISLKAGEMSRDTNGSSGSRPSTTGPGKTQYRLIEYVEDLDRYCPGGYHPLKIGDCCSSEVWIVLYSRGKDEVIYTTQSQVDLQSNWLSV